MIRACPWRLGGGGGAPLVAVARGVGLCGAAVGGVGGGSRLPPPVGARMRSRGGLLGYNGYFTGFLVGSQAAFAASVSAKAAVSMYPLR